MGEELGVLRAENEKLRKKIVDLESNLLREIIRFDFAVEKIQELRDQADGLNRTLQALHEREEGDQRNDI